VKILHESSETAATQAGRD